MKKIILGLSSLVILIGCVKETKDISPNLLFNIKVDEKKIEEAIIVADNSTKHKIEIEALNGLDIDNDKTATISVSNGSLAPISNLTAPAGNTNIPVTIIGGKAVFYYMPGMKAQKPAVLSITLEGLSQAVNFTINPSEPDKLELFANPSSPTLDQNLELTAYLTKNTSFKSYVSSDLPIEFSAKRYDNQGDIEPVITGPLNSFTIFDEQTGFVTARKNILTNKQPGKMLVTASYTKENKEVISDEMIVEFK